MELYTVRRSPRRTRTMTVLREDGHVVAVVPARLSRTQELTLVPPAVERFLAKELRGKAPRGDEALYERAVALANRHLNDQPLVRERLVDVRWVTNQRHRWGSCTPQNGTIRLTDRLKDAPGWVSDYVLLHELVHLVEHQHSARFRSLLARYPQADRADGFLAGLSHAWGTPMSDG